MEHRELMCSGIEYNDKLYLWTNPEVCLPVLKRDGDIAWVRWGERHGVQSPFFQGPCARLDSIEAKKWSRFNPRAVKIPMTRYMERDTKHAPYWVKPTEPSFLQGLIATWGEEQRIYVVTIDTPKEFTHVQPRWPRVITELNSALSANIKPDPAK